MLDCASRRPSMQADDYLLIFYLFYLWFFILFLLLLFLYIFSYTLPLSNTTFAWSKSKIYLFHKSYCHCQGRVEATGSAEQQQKQKQLFCNKMPMPPSDSQLTLSLGGKLSAKRGFRNGAYCPARLLHNTKSFSVKRWWCDSHYHQANLHQHIPAVAFKAASASASASAATIILFMHFASGQLFPFLSALCLFATLTMYVCICALISTTGNFYLFHVCMCVSTAYFPFLRIYEIIM